MSDISYSLLATQTTPLNKLLPHDEKDKQTCDLYDNFFDIGSICKGQMA